MANNRLLSLDVMRGMTIAGMILVNNPGTWAHIYAPLRHAEWLGLTPTDLVFPFFMFIMGVSTCFSLRKYDYKMSRAALAKVLRRTLLIFLIGWALVWIARAWSGFLDPEKSFIEAINIFGTLRFLGVFPRLAICYGVTALLALWLDRRKLTWLAAGLLVVYAVLLLVGNGLEFAHDNIIAVVDRAVLGESHMYTDTVDGVSMRFDPEGLLSTIPSIAHCIIGFLCGGMLMRVKDNTLRSYNLLLVGSVLTMAGFLLDYGMPISKKIWSPTFVLTTCGLAAMLLGLLIWVIDIKGHRGWCTFFRVFGVNPLFLYCLSTLMAISLNRLSVTIQPESLKISLHSLIYNNYLLTLCGDNAMLASLVFAVLFVLANWCVGYILYRKKIYIKI